MHGLHYNHTKEFKEKQFKEWSEKARELRDSYTDEQIENFKIELKKLSDFYYNFFVLLKNKILLITKKILFYEVQIWKKQVKD